jgi:hypothetical protein
MKLFCVLLPITLSLLVYINGATLKNLSTSFFSKVHIPLNKKVVSTLLSSAFLFNSPAISAVGEGDLPEGSLAFSKVLKFQVIKKIENLSCNLES